MGAAGSKGGKGGTSAAGTIESRHIVRKANKEDLFTVATYSILAESTISETSFPYWSKKDRKAKRRHPQLLAELQTLSASVVCLQNVETEFFQSVLKPELGKLGYEGELKSLSKTTKIGVATFYHSRTFRLLKTHNISLTSAAKDLAKRKGGQLDAKAAGLANNSGALVLLLQLLPDKHSKQHCVAVANTQLGSSEGAPDVQALEAALLLKELQAYAEHVQEWKDGAGLEETSVGYVVAGDLGAGPKSPQYGLLKRGHLEEKEEKKLRKCPKILAGKGMSVRQEPLFSWFEEEFAHKWGALKSAYSTVVGKEPGFTVYTDRSKACRDYLWYTGDNLNANTALQVPDEAALKPLVGLPNEKYPSDHLPLVFGFRFKKSAAFTTRLPFNEPSGTTSNPDGEGGEDEDDLAPRDLDDILGFKMPTDKTTYDRFGYERTRSGISAAEDLAPDAWKPAERKGF